VLVAEESFAERIDAGRFARRASRWCDEAVVVPASVLDQDAGNEAVAAYARLDRLLSSLDGRDCVVVVGEGLRRQGDPGDPGEPQASLAALVDGWLQLAHPPVWGRRHAA
jgi:hypothetical protein